MNPVPLVSIIVPLYNKNRTVERSLRSISGQTYDDFEVLIVDDGSTDRSAEVAAEFPDPRFRLIRQNNAGPGAARNRGIAEARGKYLAFLDADDEWMPFFLAQAIPRLEGDSQIAAVTYSWLDEPGGASPLPALQRMGLQEGPQSLSPRAPRSQLLAGIVFMWPCSTVARTDVVRSMNGFYAANRCRYSEDSHLWLKIWLNHPVCFVLEPAAHFHREASELSGNYRGMRPIEPFLTDPDDVRRVCPEALRDLLEQFLAMRAMKTACVLAYWGQWRDASKLREQFSHPACRWEKLSLMSWCAATPFGALAGGIARLLR